MAKNKVFKSSMLRGSVDSLYNTTDEEKALMKKILNDIAERKIYQVLHYSNDIHIVPVALCAFENQGYYIVGKFINFIKRDNPSHISEEYFMEHVALDSYVVRIKYTEFIDTGNFHPVDVADLYTEKVIKSSYKLLGK